MIGGYGALRGTLAPQRRASLRRAAPSHRNKGTLNVMDDGLTSACFRGAASSPRTDLIRRCVIVPHQEVGSRDIRHF